VILDGWKLLLRALLFRAHVNACKQCRRLCEVGQVNKSEALVLLAQVGCGWLLLKQERQADTFHLSFLSLVDIPHA